jgi:translocation and assembly module TamB
VALLAGRAARLSGDVSGQAWIAARNGAITGNAAIQLNGVDLAARNRDPVNATFTADLAPRALNMRVSARSAAGLSLDMKGLVPIESRAAPLTIARAAQPARFDWSLNGPIDSVWRIVGPLGVSAGGRVDGAGQLVIAAPGGASAPLSGSGSLQLTGARVEDRASGVRLVDISATARLRADGLAIENMRASDGAGGKLFAQGRLGAAGDGELLIDLDDLRLIRRPDVTARGDGKLTLAWTPKGARLSGAIDLIDADARQPQSAAPRPTPIAVEEINRPVAEHVTAPRPIASLPVTLDLKLTGARRLCTRARGLEAEWALDARIAGDAQTPLIYGEARLLRGQATLAGRPMTFERGLVRFDGPMEAATIDMRARIDAPTLTATLALSGPLADPQLDTSSTPPLPQDEILPQALFGVNAEQLSPLQAAQLAATLAALSGRSAFDIANVARAAVNLDRLDVREDGEGLLLTGGKYVTRDVYLEVSRGPLGQTTSSVEWQVRPRLFVISSFLANGDPKLAVRWRREY